MDHLPPTYQEATRKDNWVKRIFVRLFFSKSSSQPAPYTDLILERKLGGIERSSSSGSTTKKTRSKRCSKALSIGASGSGSNFIPPTLPNSHRSSLHQSTALSPPTNYVRIKRFAPTPNPAYISDIAGVWNIDTSLVVPEELLVPFKDKSEKRHHLHLWSDRGRVDADVNVVESSSASDREETVLLTASSEGAVSLRIAKPAQRTLSVFMRGSIISIRIPRSYRGTLKAHSGSGSVHFSASVRREVRVIYEKGKESRWFIGQMNSGSGSESNDEKHDEMKLKAKSRQGEKYGEIFVAYEDEVDPAVNI